MTAKEYLNQLKAIDARIRSIDRDIEVLRTEQISLRSAWPDGQPHGTGISDPVAMQAVKVADELGKLEVTQMKWRWELMRKRVEISNTIAMLNDGVLQQILYDRYVERKSFEQIAVDIGYSWRHTIRLHGTALFRIQEIIKDVIECHTYSQ